MKEEILKHSSALSSGISSVVVDEALPWGHPVAFMSVPVREQLPENSVLSAKSDCQAVHNWLIERGGYSKNTIDAYRLEAERLILWASEVKGVCLSDLKREDFLLYKNFLENIPETWQCPRGTKRLSTDWKPFCTQLSLSSIKYSLTVVYSLMQYLHLTGWIAVNPMPQPKVQVHAKWRPTRKAIPAGELDCVLRSIDEALKTSSPRETVLLARDRWMVVWLSEMAPRVSETAVRMSSITKEVISGETVWVWDVVGKGSFEDSIPLSDKVIMELLRFRKVIGAPGMPFKAEPTPLFPKLNCLAQDGKIYDQIPGPMTRSAIYRRIKEVIIPRALFYAKANGLSVDAGLLRSVSTHWFRHTALTNIADKTKDMRMVQALGRHRNVTTSAGYVRVDLVSLKEAME